jgi:hypothetical protein
MGTPLYTTDIIPLTSRPTLTVMDDGDYFVILDTSTGKISKILKTLAMEALKISYDNSTSGLTAENVQAALDELVVDLGSAYDAISAIKGTGWTDENLVDHEERIDSVELALARQGQDLASVKQTLQQGNGATLDFDDIGIVPLDARATGRANPTVEGRTATNYVNGDFEENLDGWVRNGGLGNLTRSSSDVPHGLFKLSVINPTGGSISNGDYMSFAYPFVAGHIYYISAYIGSGGNATLILGTDTQTLISQYLITSTVLTNSIFTAQEGDTEIRFGQGTGANIYMYLDALFLVDLTSSFGAGNEPSESDCAKIFSYFDGTKSIQLPARIISKSEDESETSTLYIADNEEVRSIQDVSDTVSVVNGEHMLTKKISTPVSVLSGVAVNVTNYPTAKTGGKFAVELTAGGTQIGIIGTDSTSGAGTLRFELTTPLTINLTTSGILQAKQNGTVYYEPYYEGSHQTDAFSQITLPYEGTIEAVYGYDEDLVEYLLDSSEYSLTGTTLTITDALENEVWFVKMSRSEGLAPELTVNTLNNEQVIADTSNGKFYKLIPTITNGALVSQTPVEVV